MIALRSQVRIHTGEKPVREQCLFLLLLLLAGVSRGLSGAFERVFKEIQRFSRQFGLICFLLVLFFYSQYVCKLCGRACAQAGNLKSHYRHYHKVVVRNVSMFQENDFPVFERLPTDAFDRYGGTGENRIEE